VAEHRQIIETPSEVRLHAGRGLAIIDVDEVLALFVQGFDKYLRTRGYEWRMNAFALFSNIYAAEAAEPVAMTEGHALFNAFFAEGCGALEPAPGAAEGLARLARAGQVVILTNAPESARGLRSTWLKTHGMDYPMIISSGLKGGPVSILAAKVEGPVMFVDDLLPNLDSVADAAPHVERFQMIADPALRRLAPTRPERHTLVADWPTLAAMGEALLSA
jgi:hypothetical protein